MNEHGPATPPEGHSLSQDDAGALYYYLELAAALRRTRLSTPTSGAASPPHAGALVRDLLSVASAYALLPQDLVAPAPFTCGAALVRGIPCSRLQRARGLPLQPFDIADLSVGLLPPTRDHGAALSPPVGAALAAKQRGDRRVVLAHLAASACDAGDFHEALNMAAVTRVALVVLVEREDAAPGRTVEGRSDPTARAAGYGLPARHVEAADVSAVYSTIRDATTSARDECQCIVIDASVSSVHPLESDAADSRAASEQPPRAFLAYMLDRRLITEGDAMALDRRIQAELAGSDEAADR